MWVSFFTGIILGLAGSLHCVGMCGPLVLMVSGGFWSSVIYHLGRTLVYFILGFLFGWAFQLTQLGALEQMVSLGFGSIFLLLALSERMNWFHLNNIKLVGHSSEVMNSFGRIYAKSGLGWKFFAGMLNGMLPCGLVYAALFASMAQKGAYGGAIFMSGFGLATMPALLLVGAFSSFVKSFIKKQGKNLLPIWLLIMGLIFLLRGLNLGIPYVSPKLDNVNQKGGNCCEK